VFDFSPEALIQKGLYLILLVLSLSVHEFAHAWSAWHLGDDTAARAGRLTLNPLVHMDPIGTFLLPLLGIPFGWARPVPVDPRRFRRGVNMYVGMALTAVAGPAANVVLAVLSGGAMLTLSRFAPGLVDFGTVGRQFLLSLVGLNVGLALFNLLPVPPLDGSRIVDGFIPYGLRPAWERFLSLAPFLLLAVFWFGGRFVSGPVNAAVDLVRHLSRAIILG
jgi:Zn-dependent protease